jgi:hypothetical protein
MDSSLSFQERQRGSAERRRKIMSVRDCYDLFVAFGLRTPTGSTLVERRSLGAISQGCPSNRSATCFFATSLSCTLNL